MIYDHHKVALIFRYLGLDIYMENSCLDSCGEFVDFLKQSNVDF